MELAKLIKQLNITTIYKPLVDDFLTQIRQNFPHRIHSIYMCGSIPKGIAIPYSSDADFTLVFYDEVTSDELDKIEDIKKTTLKKYPIIRKIDTPTCSVSEVLQKLNEWGFWIKIVSICLYGDDLSNNLPPIFPNIDLVKGINADTIKNIDDMQLELLQTKTIELRNRLQKKLSRRLILALFTLIIPITKIWTDDIEVMSKLLIQYNSENADLLTYLYSQYISQNNNIKEFEIKVHEARSLFIQGYHFI